MIGKLFRLVQKFMSMNFHTFMKKIQKEENFILPTLFVTQINEETKKSTKYKGFSEIFEVYVDLMMKTSLKRVFEREEDKRKDIFKEQEKLFWFFCLSKAYQNSQKSNSQLNWILFLFWFSNTKNSQKLMLHEFGLLAGKTVERNFILSLKDKVKEKNKKIHFNHQLSLSIWVDNFIKFHCTKNSTKTHLDLIQKNRSTVSTIEFLTHSIKINKKIEENFKKIFKNNLFGKFSYILTI